MFSKPPQIYSIPPKIYRKPHQIYRRPPHIKKILRIGWLVPLEKRHNTLVLSAGLYLMIMVLQRAFDETGRSWHWHYVHCQRKIIFRSCSTYLLFSGLKLPRVGSVLFFVIMQMSSFILPVIKASTTSLDILFYLYHQSLIFRQSNLFITHKGVL